MPDQSPNQTELRASGNWMRVYVSFFVGNVVATGTVTATPANGATTLAVTVSTGSAANIKRGMTVYVKSSGGDLKGVTRVRYSGQTIDATNLPIRENARGTINIVSGDTWEVRDDVRLSDKLVEADEAFNPDGLAYSDQNSNQRPIACGGGHWAGYVSMLPITTAGDGSATVDPDSVSGVVHNWIEGSLSYASGNATSANPSFTGSAGEYWIPHEVTDVDNTKTTTQYNGYRIHDDNDPPFEGLMEAPSGDEENGWSARFRPFDPVLLANIPDGCLAIVWKQEYMAGSQQSFGAAVPGRSHILMTGYLRREDGAFTGDTGVEELTFEIISPMARLQELIGYSKVMISEASPDAWSEMKTLTVRRAILQIVAVYTSLQQSGFDFIVHSNYSDAVYPRFYLQKAEPLAQLRELADGRDARIICDRTGRFELQTRPELVPIADRASAVITLAIESEDFIDWQYTREHDGTVEIVECQGLTAGASPAPVFSRWPGLTPGTGNEATTVTRLIADTQTDLNLRCARRGAALNGTYMDANGVKHRAVELTITLPGSYHVFDFYAEYVQFDKVTALRGLDFLDHLFYAKSVAYEPDDRGAGKVRLTLRTATNAVGAQTYVPLTEADSNLPTINNPDLEWGPLSAFSPGNPFLLNKGTGKIAYFNDDGNAYLTSDHTTSEAAGGPTYETVALAGLGMSGTLMDAIVFAFSPLYLGTGTEVHGWICTDEEIGYLEDVGDVDSGRTYTAQHTFAANPAGTRRVMQAERGVPNWVIVASYYPADKTTATYTTDGGTTWTEVTVSTFNASGGSVNEPGLWIDPHTAGRALIIAFKTTAAATPTSGAFETTDYGATWNAITDPALDASYRLGGTLDGPYAASDVFYFGKADFVGAIYLYTLYKETSSGAVNVSPNVAGDDYGPDGSGGKRQIRSHDTDANLLLLIGYTTSDGATTKVGVFVSKDAGVTWTAVIAPDNANLGVYTAAAIGGDGLAGYVFGEDGMYFTDNIKAATVVFESKKGNLGTIGRNISLWGW